MLATGDPAETEYTNRLDAINFLVRDMDLPHDLRRRMRQYMRTTKDTRKRDGYRALIDQSFR